MAGLGAGTFEQAWLKDHPVTWKIRDAHNLYVEVLAELGPIGLAVLLFAFSIPIVAAVRVRSHPLAPLAAGAYAAYLFHAGVDWDLGDACGGTMPAVTLAALFCGVAIIVVARSNSEGWSLSLRARVSAVVATLTLGTFLGRRIDGKPRDRSKQQRRSDSNWSRPRATRMMRSAGCPGLRILGG